MEHLMQLLGFTTTVSCAIVSPSGQYFYNEVRQSFLESGPTNFATLQNQYIFFKVYIFI